LTLPSALAVISWWAQRVVCCLAFTTTVWTVHMYSATCWSSITHTGHDVQCSCSADQTGEQEYSGEGICWVPSETRCGAIMLSCTYNHPTSKIL